MVDERVLKAVLAVDRRMFVPDQFKEVAYEDRPLPIEFSQTISQPYTVARMVELLIERGKDEKLKKMKVLEVGTGSGWQTAALSKLFRQVYSVERIPELAWRAEIRIGKLEIRNVKIKIGDGKKGWGKYAPYDGIIVAADAQDIPKTLVEQLTEEGRIVAPERGRMRRGTKINDRMGWEDFGEFAFVPLV